MYSIIPGLLTRVIFCRFKLSLLKIKCLAAEISQTLELKRVPSSHGSSYLYLCVILMLACHEKRNWLAFTGSRAFTIILTDICNHLLLTDICNHLLLTDICNLYWNDTWLALPIKVLDKTYVWIFGSCEFNDWIGNTKKSRISDGKSNTHEMTKYYDTWRRPNVETVATSWILQARWK